MEPQKQKAAGMKRSKSKQFLQKAKLEAATIKLVVKASLPPAIGIAIYQATSVQQQYGTLGYLVAISALIGFAIMPRAKFIQSMILNIIAIGFATAVNTLALFCVVQARLHNSSATEAQVQTYNATASTVCAIWLVVQIYVVNVVRAARPQFQHPAILYSIFVSNSMTNGVAFLTMATATTFITNLLEAFLSGFAIATGVSLVVFPMSSRQTVWKEMSAYLRLFQGALAVLADNKSDEHVKLEDEHIKHQKSSKVPTTSAQTRIRDKLLALHSKLDGDLTWAKREVSYGKLEPDHLVQLWKLMRMLLLPVMGLLSMVNTTELQGEKDDSMQTDEPGEDLQQCRKQLERANLPSRLHGKLLATVATVDSAFQHILLTLELVEPCKGQIDEEYGGEAAKPGTLEFAGKYKERGNDIYSTNRTLGDWCREHDVALPSELSESLAQSELGVSQAEYLLEQPHDLLFALYFEYMLSRINSSVLDFVNYADELKRDGVLRRAKLIVPGSKTLRKWARSAWVGDHLGTDDYYTVDVDSQSLPSNGKLGKSIDPEHFPPRNAIQRLGSAVRLIPKFFRSEQSRYGLRVAIATFSIGIVCYLRDTQRFFLRQRLRWALNTVAFAMTRTAGQSFLGFSLRLLGTIIAMLASYVIWYIVDGKAPGVIVFLWLWILLVFYVAMKQPKLTQAAVLNLVTVILIIGYELQVKAIGVERAEESGQPAYPTYELAPYRLAAVSGGVVVAFFWTIFPYPISESSELRKDVSSSLYLLSSYYRVTHELVKTRLRGGEGSERDHQLTKSSHLLFSDLLRLSNNLKKNSTFSKFQIHVGGSFPRHEYEELTDCIRRLTLWISLASYSCNSFQSGHPRDTPASSNHDILTAPFGKITSLLSLLASSLSNAQPLPTSFDSIKQRHFVQRLLPESSNQDIAAAEQLSESGYRVLAAMHIVSQHISGDLATLVRCVKKLVGEIEIFTGSDDLSLRLVEDGVKVD